ncbi:MAG TPA: prepilin-type N-terminal cleavage/methylation domain-containing protein [Phycisphaerae bacterium]|nr:prepilin-type N-terminal cleavage/methylation domain-containing protein [Phycisphaerae bacterium]
MRTKSPVHRQPVLRPHAFTLIELLVVVAIIAVLIAILIPSLAHSRAQTRMVACRSNLRSIGQLLYIYSSMFGSLPIGDGQDPNGNYLRWYQTLQATADSSASYNSSSPNLDIISKLRRMYIDPDVPGGDAALHLNNYQGNNTLNLIQYDCHPLVMPSIPGITGTPGRPFKLETIQRGDLALVFDTTLTVYPGNLWRVKADGAVATWIDNGAIYGPTHLLGPDSTHPLGNSIDMANNNNGAYKPNTDDLTNTQGYTQNIRFRHLNDTRVNVVMTDGHVDGFGCNQGLMATNPSSPNVTEFTRRYLYLGN